MASTRLAQQDQIDCAAQSAARCLFIVPGSIDRVTGGSIYDKRLADYLVERGTRVEVASVPDLPYFLSLMISLPVALWLAPKLFARRYDLVIEDGWAHPALAVLNLICCIFRCARVVVIVHQLRWLEKKSPLAAGFVSMYCQ